jgi:hypothetical protein
MAKRATSSNAQPSLRKFKDRAFRSHIHVSLYIQHRPLIALAAFAHGIDFTCPVVGLSEMRGLLLPKKIPFLRFRFLSRTPDHHFLRHAGTFNSAFSRKTWQNRRIRACCDLQVIDQFAELPDKPVMDVGYERQNAIPATALSAPRLILISQIILILPPTNAKDVQAWGWPALFFFHQEPEAHGESMSGSTSYVGWLTNY